MSDNLMAFCDCIASCEGTDGPDGYRALFGYRPGNGRVFSSFSMHPNLKAPFIQTDGTVNYSTAAGRYQIVYPTFRRLSIKLGLADFSPGTQDAMAAELISEAGAMADVKEGRLQDAIDKCSDIWASLPNSRYPQPKRTFVFATEAYLNAGGAVA